MNSIVKELKFHAIVIGVSSGAHAVLQKILPVLEEDLPVPIIIVRHLHHHSDNYAINELNEKCKLLVKTADEKEKVQPGVIYFAPSNYHLLIEDDRTFALSTTAHVKYARPSIDVLFESASDVYREKLISIILTGANDDGCDGLEKIKNRGGLAIVQDPLDAEVKRMPNCAINRINADFILPAQQIAPQIMNLVLNEK